MRYSCTHTTPHHLLKYIFLGSKVIFCLTHDADLRVFTVLPQSESHLAWEPLTDFEDNQSTKGQLDILRVIPISLCKAQAYKLQYVFVD